MVHMVSLVPLIGSKHTGFFSTENHTNAIERNRDVFMFSKSPKVSANGGHPLPPVGVLRTHIEPTQCHMRPQQKSHFVRYIFP